MGAFFGSVMFIVISLVLNRPSTKSVPVVRYSQSRLIQLISLTDIDYSVSYEEDDRSDDDDDDDSEDFVVVFLENRAYWIEGDDFFVADTEEDEVLVDTKAKVDTMTMSPVELKKLIKVVEILRGNA